MKTMMSSALSSVCLLLIAALCLVGPALADCDSTSVATAFPNIPDYIVTDQCASVADGATCDLTCGTNYAGQASTLTCSGTDFSGSLPACQEKRPRIQIQDASLRIGVYNDEQVEVAYLGDDNLPNAKSGRILSAVEVNDAISTAIAAPEFATAAVKASTNDLAADGPLKTAIQALVDSASPADGALANLLDDLWTCPPGHHRGTSGCVECPDRTYSYATDKADACTPCVDGTDDGSLPCPKTTGPINAHITVSGWSKDGVDCEQPGKWLLEDLHSGCWDGAFGDASRITTDNDNGQNDRDVYARSLVTFQRSGIYRFFCHADDHCGIKIRRDNDWFDMIPYTGGRVGCCQSHEYSHYVAAGDYEVEYRAREDGGGFFMNFFFYPEVLF